MVNVMTNGQNVIWSNFLKTISKFTVENVAEIIKLKHPLSTQKEK